MIPPKYWRDLYKNRIENLETEKNKQNANDNDIIDWVGAWVTASGRCERNKRTFAEERRCLEEKVAYWSAKIDREQLLKILPQNGVFYKWFSKTYNEDCADYIVSFNLNDYKYLLSE